MEYILIPKTIACFTLGVITGSILTIGTLNFLSKRLIKKEQQNAQKLFNLLSSVESIDNKQTKRTKINNK